MHFPSICGRRSCHGGDDVHPDLMIGVTENATIRRGLGECCRWSLYHEYKQLIDAYGPAPTGPGRLACRFGKICYNLSAEHLYLFSHPGDTNTPLVTTPWPIDY